MTDGYFVKIAFGQKSRFGLKISTLNATQSRNSQNCLWAKKPFWTKEVSGIFYNIIEVKIAFGQKSRFGLHMDHFLWNNHLSQNCLWAKKPFWTPNTNRTKSITNRVKIAFGQKSRFGLNYKSSTEEASIESKLPLGKKAVLDYEAWKYNN